ncbi:hypothetical protein D3C86_2156730 [compost metagenome]
MGGALHDRYRFYLVISHHHGASLARTANLTARFGDGGYQRSRAIFPDAAQFRLWFRGRENAAA